MRDQYLLGFISGYCLAAFVNVSIVAVLALEVLRVAHAAALQAERLAQMGTAEVLQAPPGVPKDEET
jgi:hypothetical protein